jgi:hypothetical protein
MSYGKDERHVHKHIWKLPIPEFDPGVPALQRLADLGALASQLVSQLDLSGEVHFSAIRRQVRSALASDEQTREIDDIVYELLS